jgi:hypothetical protein
MPLSGKFSKRLYWACITPGGFQSPLPAGRIDGGVSFGQYKRITR